MESLERRVEKLERRVFRLLQPGRIEQAEYATTPPRVRVRLADRLSDWVPFVAGRAGNDKSWWPPEVGEEVMVLSPNGEALAAVALAALYHDQRPAPGDRPDLARFTFADGAVFEYDRAASVLSVSLPGEARVQVVGDVTAQVGGNLAATVDGTAEVDAASIHLNQGNAVVTTGHICHFTGNPHGDGSSTVTAGE